LNVNKDEFTPQLEFSIWKGNSKKHGTYVTGTGVISTTFAPTVSGTYRLNLRLRQYGYSNGAFPFYIDDVTILDVTNLDVIVTNSAEIPIFVPDVLSYNDYYPFGMLVPNRHESSNSYRYGFQGQEKDDEVKGEGNSINYKYRMHDPRVGRFFSVDPLTAEYPHYTPYSFSGNKVIAYRELEGLEEIHFTYTFNYNLTEKTGWRRYVPFMNNPSFSLSEGTITDYEIQEASDLKYKITLRVPVVYAHNRNSPSYKTYTYSGKNMVGLDDPSNWVGEPDYWGAFQEGFGNGVSVALIDNAGEALMSSFTKAIIKSKVWRTARLNEMKNWLDPGRIGKKLRPDEINSALDFEQRFKIFLKASTTKGDFMGLVGKYKNKVFDQFGSTAKGMSYGDKSMKQFKGSIDVHFKKLSEGVDFLFLDFKNFSKGQIKQCKGYINKTYSNQKDKIFYLNDG
jgi:RHS repeat-associated protein